MIIANIFCIYLCFKIVIILQKRCIKIDINQNKKQMFKLSFYDYKKVIKLLDILRKSNIKIKNL